MLTEKICLTDSLKILSGLKEHSSCGRSLESTESLMSLGDKHTYGTRLSQTRNPVGKLTYVWYWFPCSTTAPEGVQSRHNLSRQRSKLPDSQRSIFPDSKLKRMQARASLWASWLSSPVRKGALATPSTSRNAQ